MKNTVLLNLVGLPRTFKRTAEYLFKNLININPDYDFNIIINTDTKFINAPKHDLKRSKYSYDTLEELEKEFKLVYGNNLKKIYYFDYIYDGQYDTMPWLLRVCDTLNKESTKFYDYYIILRMDTIIVNPVYLNNYIDTFLILTHPYTRPGTFLNNDWDLCWITDKKSFFLFLKPFLIYFKNEYNDSRLDLINIPPDVTIINKELTQEEIQNTTSKASLTGIYASGIWKGVYNLIINNKNFCVIHNVHPISGEEKYNNEYLFEQPELLMKV